MKSFDERLAETAAELKELASGGSGNRLTPAELHVAQQLGLDPARVLTSKQEARGTRRLAAEDPVAIRRPVDPAGDEATALDVKVRKALGLPETATDAEVLAQVVRLGAGPEADDLDTLSQEEKDVAAALGVSEDFLLRKKQEERRKRELEAERELEKELLNAKMEAITAGRPADQIVKAANLSERAVGAKPGVTFAPKRF